MENVMVVAQILILLKVPSDGTKCTKTETINSDSMVCPNTTDFVKNGSMCYGPCPTGYTRDGNNCVKSFAALDENSMACLPTETRHGAFCYTTCPTGYTDLEMENVKDPLIHLLMML